MIDWLIIFKPGIAGFVRKIDSFKVRNAYGDHAFSFTAVFIPLFIVPAIIGYPWEELGGRHVLVRYPVEGGICGSEIAKVHTLHPSFIKILLKMEKFMAHVDVGSHKDAGCLLRSSSELIHV